MNLGQDLESKHKKSSENSFEFTVGIDVQSGHLVLRRSSVSINGQVVSHGLKPKQTKVLRYALLALAEYVFQGQTEFKPVERHWRSLQDCVRKQRGSLADPTKSSAAIWAKTVFGSIDQFNEVFHPSERGVSINTAVVPRENVKFHIDGHADFDDSKKYGFIRDRILRSSSKRDVKPALQSIEPNEELRKAVAQFADRAIDIGGIDETMKLVAGKLIWYVRLRDLLDLFDDEILGAAGGVIDEIIDEFSLRIPDGRAEMDGLVARIDYCIRVCKKLREYARLVDVELNGVLRSLQVLKLKMATDWSREQSEALLKLAESARLDCQAARDSLSSRIRECREKLKIYLLQ